jgi:hypothetical protein
MLKIQMKMNTVQSLWQVFSTGSLALLVGYFIFTLQYATLGLVAWLTVFGIGVLAFAAMFIAFSLVHGHEVKKIGKYIEKLEKGEKLPPLEKL